MKEVKQIKGQKGTSCATVELQNQRGKTVQGKEREKEAPLTSPHCPGLPQDTGQGSWVTLIKTHHTHSAMGRPHFSNCLFKL